jgi:heme o synthase
VVLFLVVFFWTPPHFWALAMRYREDYAAAGVPMLPVVATAHAVARQIVGYAVVTVATSLVLWPVARTGPVYPIIASGLGAVFVGEALLLLRRSRISDDLAVLQPMRLFHFSNSYLTLLFLAVAFVPFVR